MSATGITYDAVIVGAGVSGALVAKQLGLAGKKVLILEAGDVIPTNVNDFMTTPPPDRFGPVVILRSPGKGSLRRRRGNDQYTGAPRPARIALVVIPGAARRPAKIAADNASRYVARASSGAMDSRRLAAPSSSGAASLPRLVTYAS